MQRQVGMGMGMGMGMGILGRTGRGSPHGMGFGPDRLAGSK